MDLLNAITGWRNHSHHVGSSVYCTS